MEGAVTGYDAARDPLRLRLGFWPFYLACLEALRMVVMFLALVCGMLIAIRVLLRMAGAAR
jgi:hypothetical protein